MSVWLTIPSKSPKAQECVDAWRGRGYKVALFRDSGDAPVNCDLVIEDKYPGYAVAVNRLIRDVCAADAEANWFIAAGDDILPDQHHTPEKIAAQCEEHFGRMVDVTTCSDREQKFIQCGGPTLGVMQPTGDPWADAAGRMIDRIAGSPWIGREFAERSYGGRGPYCELYTHCFLDNEIMDVAKMLGIFWQRPDLTHFHQHWTRDRRPMPQYLRDANSQAHWEKYSRIYFDRKRRGFPGHELRAVEVCA